MVGMKKQQMRKQLSSPTYMVITQRSKSAWNFLPAKSDGIPILLAGEISHGTVLGRAMELCRDEAVQELLGC